MIKVCKICNKEFEPHSWASGQQSTYQCICDNCSTYNKLERTKICPVCGREFKITRKSVKEHWLNIVYCSLECANAVEIEQKCSVCGRIFKSKVTREGKPKQKICSEYCANTVDIVLKCEICGENFITHPLLDGRKRTTKFCNNCRPKERVKNISKTCLEKYGVSYPCLTENCKSSNPQANSKINEDFCKLLSRYGLDFDTEYSIGSKFCYDVRLGNNLVEINPTITHTSIDYIPIFSAKDANYHLNKSNYAVDNGYRCIHVWQWDNWDKIVQLLLPKQKLYARKLQLKVIDKSTANTFLDTFHLQGSCYNNRINLGLYLNNRLVQVMTFGEPRYNRNYQWELLRLCSCSEYCIVGGAEKLFKYFIRNYKPVSVISYCDISKFSGNVYNRIGFKLKKLTKPQKIWSKNSNYITDNLLRQRGADQLIGTHDGKGTDNEEVMIREGWLPVYDCGQMVFEFTGG